MEQQVQQPVRVDLNKTAPTEACKKVEGSEFFFCPECGGQVDTLTHPCPSGDECFVGAGNSIFASFGCRTCHILTPPTHWELH